MLKRGFDYELSLFELMTCEVQGEVFSDCQYPPNNCDAIDFITKYMQSDIVADMDRELSIYSGWGAAQLGEAFHLFHSVKKLDKRINDSCLEWIGYVYRYWNRWLGTRSKEIVKEAPPDVMCSGYGGLHTLSPEEAIRLLKRQAKKSI